MKPTIEDFIKEQIEQLDIKKMVQFEIKKIIFDDVEREITNVTKEEIQRTIRAEIKICMSKGVQTDDGWGNKKNYDSFEMLFKQYFREALDNTYEVKRTISDYMRTETNKLIGEKTKEIVEALKKSLGA